MKSSIELSKTTKFKEKIYLGKVDNLNTYLAAPSWDCDWYWGFGYIQNKDMHTHFDCLFLKKSLDSKKIKEYFGSNGVISKLTDSELWQLMDLFQSFYTLKKVAELYHQGNSHISSVKGLDLKNQAEYERINEVVLPSIFDAIYDLLNK